MNHLRDVVTDELEQQLIHLGNRRLGPHEVAMGAPDRAENRLDVSAAVVEAESSRRYTLLSGPTGRSHRESRIKSHPGLVFPRAFNSQACRIANGRSPSVEQNETISW